MINFCLKNVKCLIVQCQFSKFSFWNYTEVCELAGAKYTAAPLGLMTVAALLPQQWTFKLIDENVEPLLSQHLDWADIVMTGGMLPQQQEINILIQKAHEFDCLIAVGGPDPSSQPHLYSHADYLVLGEGEITIPLFLEDLNNGKTSGQYSSSEFADMNKTVVPRFDLIRFDDYLQVGIQYSRGCPFKCEFCDIIELYGRKPRTKTTEQVILELETLYNLGYRGHVDIVDDNFIGNKRNVKKLLPAIKEWSKKRDYPFFYSTEISINLADDEKLMQMMKEVDFRFVFVGIETPENKILESVKKTHNVNKPLVEMIKKINEHGMIVMAGFILGFDGESTESAKKMINCINDTGISIVMIGLLYALSNTQLSRRLSKEGRLFVEGNEMFDGKINIDQATSGLNFITQRPRLEVLKNFVSVVRSAYTPDSYFNRVIYTGLTLRSSNKYRPKVPEILKILKAFFKVCEKLGFNSFTGKFYWKMFFTVLFKNPSAIEAVVNLSAIYIHLYKQSQFIIQLTEDKIKNIENIGEKEYNKLMVLENPSNELDFKLNKG